MEARTIFLMIYLIAFQLSSLSAFHLDGVKKNLKTLHSPYQAHTLTETINASESKPVSSAQLNGAELPSKNNDKKDVKPWSTANNSVSEKSSQSLNIANQPIKVSGKHSLNIANHPKRQSINYPTWHKITKEPHKFSTVDNGRENGFHGFDFVVVDIPSRYSRMHWDKYRPNSLASPSLRYAPINRSPSIFDLLMGLDSMSENVLTEPAVMGNEVYFQQSSDDPSWSRHASFGPTITQQKAINVNRFAKDASATKFFGKSTEPAKNCTCICEEQKNVLKTLKTLL